MLFFDWKKIPWDEDVFTWTPYLEQVELFGDGGTEVADAELHEGREASEARVIVAPTLIDSGIKPDSLHFGGSQA